MEKPTIVLKYVQSGRTKYLLLTLVPSLVLLFLMRHLIGNGHIPNERGLAYLLLLIPLALLWFLTYVFIYRKIHSIAVYEDRLVETDRRGTEHIVYLSSVRSLKTNWLGELVLKDTNGKTLLHIEENMENREQLVHRLQSLVQ